MYKTILLPVDSSPFSQSAAQYALEFSRRLGAGVRLLAVKDSRVINAGYWQDFGALTLPTLRMDGELDRFFEQRARDLITHYGSVIPGAEGEVADGLPERVILDHARRADLVILGAAGEAAEDDNPGRLHLGRTVERVLRRAERPVLLAPREVVPLDRITVIYAAAPGDARALSVAADLARLLEIDIDMVATGNDVEAAANEGHGYLTAQGLMADFENVNEITNLEALEVPPHTLLCCAWNESQVETLLNFGQPVLVVR
ncbi:nucleotide-binding universal stress UspA family protein [Deinobacterium chartae]|uniref:Nucleotide-binding universal stress UspA family protein n=1 Tax=Deinobacterium chartae TaxID=521158 RepID=A0A841HW43_9DEIO|nr:universal stress protein [Deinobacterium chartae]MBB6097053.1 nucleotide-binding universal stress UspA family protein [Deinobacterium chartae]